MPGVPGITRIKVFGERNTGTNFAEQLVALNHPGLTVLRHGDNDGLETAAAAFGPALAPFVLERLIDDRRLAEFPQNFGWKHAATSAAMLRASPAFHQTVFLFLVRNPYRFLTSLWRRPYNLVQPGDGPRDVSAFLRGTILLNQRDGLRGGIVPNPVQLWNRKSRAHVRTATDLGGQALVLRYEDLVERPDLPARWLAGHGHGIDGALKVPAKSTKGDTTTFQDYRDEARTYDPARDFSADDLAFIADQLDRDLCAALHYPLAG